MLVRRHGADNSAAVCRDKRWPDGSSGSAGRQVMMLTFGTDYLTKLNSLNQANLQYGHLA